MSDLPKAAVLHVALNPVTGVWSVMRELSKVQAESGLYAAVGLGVIADSRWPALYTKELQTSGLPHYSARTPKMFGTAQFLWQRIQKPPIDRWVDDLLARSGATHCVVHFHNAWLSGAFLPLHCVEKKRARVVATFHGVNAHFRGQPVRQRIQQWMAGRLVKYKAILTSVDKANLKRAEALLKLSPARFKIIPNGISDTAARACPRLNGAKTFTVGHVGSIVPAKGWRMLVEAASKVRAAGVAINVVLAGRGSDAELAGELAKNSGGWLSYKGFVANPRETVMKDLDTLVLMSEQEGLPMAIIEAFSIGLPVIATPVGGVPEAVTDSKNGFLVPRTVEALALALQRLVDDRGLLGAMSAQARSDFEEHFEISKIVSRYHAVYQGSA
jgi:glycosyltransferase involved in cell wall biosynthesis